MHELSIAYRLVETAVAAAYQNHIDQVNVVHLRLGLLCGVDKTSLLFAYDIATANTILAASRLEIEVLPVVIFCPHCQVERTLGSVQYLCCPLCDTPAGQIIQGKEIEIRSLEYCDEPAFA